MATFWRGPIKLIINLHEIKAGYNLYPALYVRLIIYCKQMFLNPILYAMHILIRVRRHHV